MHTIRVIRFVGGPYHGEERVLVKQTDFIFVPINAKESAFVRYKLRPLTVNGKQAYDSTGREMHMATVEHRLWGPDEVKEVGAKRHQGLLQELLTQMLPPSSGSCT